MKKVLIFFWLLLVKASVSNAESWVEVGGGIYADKDSVQRNGEIGHITLSDMSNKGLIYMKFDCKRNIAFYILPSLQQSSTKDNPILSKSQELACRRPWELWK